MYSEYTVSERAVATVADCVVTSIRYALLILTCVTSIDSLISSSSHGGYVDVMHSISTCAIRFCARSRYRRQPLSHSTYFHTVRTFTQYVLSHSTYFLSRSYKSSLLRCSIHVTYTILHYRHYTSHEHHSIDDRGRYSMYVAF